MTNYKTETMPKMPISTGIEDVVTAIEVFSQFLIAFLPAINQTTEAVVRIAVGVMLSLCYLATKLRCRRDAI